MTGNETALVVWACAAIVGVPVMIALSLHINDEYTLLDLIAAIICGLAFGPLLALAWAAHKVVLRKES